MALLVPQEFGGGAYIETKYEGYGVFGGVDAYALLCRWNAPEKCVGDDDLDRSIGIDLERNARYPLKIVSLKAYQAGATYETVGPSDRDPAQGYFYEEEDDE